MCRYKQKYGNDAPTQPNVISAEQVCASNLCIPNRIVDNLHVTGSKIDYYSCGVQALNHPCVFSYLHVPVQSGSDAVLTAMNREYTSAEFHRCAAATPFTTLSYRRCPINPCCIPHILESCRHFTAHV